MPRGNRQAEPTQRALKSDPLLLTSAALAWPGNGRYQLRLAYLGLKTHFSSPNATSPPRSARSFNQLLSSLPDDEVRYFAHLEDFDPTPQTLDVPVAWNRSAYRFFFGNLERPLAFYTKFIDDFLPFDELFRNELGYRVTAAFTLALVHQDLLIQRLLPLLARATRGRGSGAGIRTPPPWFLLAWTHAQRGSLHQALNRLDADLRLEARAWVEGCLEQQPSSFQPEDLLGHHEEIARYLFIRHRGTILVPYPQFYIEGLMLHFREKLVSLSTDEPAIEPVYRSSCCQRLYDSSALLASKGPGARLFPRVTLARGRTESEEIPVAVLFDSSKLLLLDSAEAIDCDRLERAFGATGTRLTSALHHAAGRHASIKTRDGHVVPLPRNSEIFAIAVGNIPSVEACAASSSTLPQTAEVMSLTDWQAIAHHFDDFLEFFSFLTTLHQVRERTRLVFTDFLDLVAWFRDTYGAMTASLRSPSVVSLASHWWSDWEIADLAARSRERRILATLGHPEHVRSSWLDSHVLRTMDPRLRKGLMVLELDSRLFAIHVSSLETAKSDVGPNAALAEALCHHLQASSGIVTTTLDNAGLPDIVHVWLYSESTLRESRELAHLARHIDEQPDQDIIVLSTQKRSPVPEALVALIYRERFLHQFAGADNTAERHLIRYFLYGVLSLAGEPSSTADKLLETILPSRAKVISIDSIPTGHAWVNPLEPRLPSKTFQIAVYTTLAKTLANQGIAPGVYDGDAAWELVRRTLYPSLISRLDQMLAEIDRHSLLEEAYRLTENSYAHLLVQRQRLQISQRVIPLAFDPALRLSEIEQTAIRVADVGAVLVERTLMTNPSGHSPLTRDKWESIFATASEAMALVQGSLMHYHDLQGLRLILSQENGLRVDGAGPAAADLHAWRRAEATEGLASSDSEDGPTGATGQRASISNLMPRLQDIATAFSHQFGYTLDDLLVILAALSHYPVSEEARAYPLALTSVTDMCAWLRESIIDPPSSRAIHAVLRDLTLHPAKLAASEWNPWKRRSRQHRMAMKVLIPVPPRRLLGPWTAEHAAKVWLSYLDQGLLPLPDEALSPDLLRALGRYRSARNRELEQDVSQVAQRLGLPCKTNIRKLEKLFGVRPQSRTDEIDALIPVANSRTLFVLEVKDPVRSQTVADMAGELRDFFHGPKSYQAKLDRRVKYVTKAKKRILPWLGVRTLAGWRIQGAFVTRHSTPAAFFRAPAFPFTAIALLPQLLVTQSRRRARGGSTVRPSSNPRS